MEAAACVTNSLLRENILTSIVEGAEVQAPGQACKFDLAKCYVYNTLHFVGIQ